jgi:hypothetical protein
MAGPEMGSAASPGAPRAALASCTPRASPGPPSAMPGSRPGPSGRTARQRSPRRAGPRWPAIHARRWDASAIHTGARCRTIASRPSPRTRVGPAKASPTRRRPAGAAAACPPRPPRARLGPSVPGPYQRSQRDARPQPPAHGTARACDGALLGLPQGLGCRPRRPQRLVGCREPLVCVPQGGVTAPAGLGARAGWYHALGMPVDGGATQATWWRPPRHRAPSAPEDGGGMANPGRNRYRQHGSEPPRSQVGQTWCMDHEAHGLQRR